MNVVPDWVSDAVFYQIFPDRFANGDPSNDPYNTAAWDALPDRKLFHGGDIRGIIQHFDYLLDLGINAIYLNPIFQSPSTHRYNTTDYLKIDPRLGDLQDFQTLLDLAHRNQVRIILDGVFNHCGRGFFAFNDLLENGRQSPYKNWFYIKKFPINAYSPGDAHNYEAWWKIKSLPKFNVTNAETRRYLLDVVRYWTAQGIDGWRLDVPSEISDGTFWQEFRSVVKGINPQAYLVGEIWELDRNWVGETRFDGLMHYPLRETLVRYVEGEKDGPAFIKRLAEINQLYPAQHTAAMYTLLGSHDIERILTVLDGDVKKMKLAYFLLFSLPGAPSVYYGDEVGLEGGKDPDCRRTFPWNPAQWNLDLHSWIKHCIKIRRSQTLLCRGAWEKADMVMSDASCAAFWRILGNQKILVLANNSPRTAIVRVKMSPGSASIWRALTEQMTCSVIENSLEVKLTPYQGVWLCPQEALY